MITGSHQEASLKLLALVHCCAIKPTKLIRKTFPPAVQWKCSMHSLHVDLQALKVTGQYLGFIFLKNHLFESKQTNIKGPSRSHLIFISCYDVYRLTAVARWDAMKGQLLHRPSQISRCFKMDTSNSLNGVSSTLSSGFFFNLLTKGTLYRLLRALVEGYHGSLSWLARDAL